MLPLATGLMLSTVEPELRPKANALANISYNLLGFLPAPYIYGLITDQTGGKYSRWGLMFTAFMNVPIFLCLIFAWYFKPNINLSLT
jgi:MFS family permease